MGVTNDAVNLILRGEPFRNFCHSFYDEFVEQNVAFRHRAGVKSLIIRRNLGGCCDWCQNLAGIYVYGEEPKEVYRRHDSCRCLVTSKFEGQGYQDVWSKKEFEKQRDARIERENELLRDKLKNTFLQKNDTKLLMQNNSMVKERLSNELKKLTEIEIGMIRRYTGNLAYNLNRALANGKGIEKYIEEIGLLDKALGKGIITDDIIVQRKTITNYLFPKDKKIITDEDVFKLKNHIIEHDGYTSTTLEPFTYPGRNVILNLFVPKGYKGGLYIRNIAHKKYAKQNEVLFKRGLSYRIKSVKKFNDVFIIDAEVI